MAEQYWIGGFFIDLSRNQITQNKHSQTIPPKALAVLTCLAQNQGKVVSQDTLLAEVWQGTFVSPNTLQRSIAQLRKALGDDGKDQVYIKTHAKRGYSLECDVRWHENVELPKDNRSLQSAESAKQRQPLKARLHWFFIAAGIGILSFIVFKHVVTEQPSLMTINNIRSLTATDDKEFDATYTPDGQYIVFHRYMNKACVNKLWAKNVGTHEEIQLTKDWGAYGAHSFSNNGKKLVFLATEACIDPVTQPSCYNLVSLDFEEALKSPQQPSLVLQCRNSTVRKPKWLNNNDIALLQKTSNRWKLISYSMEQNTSRDLYAPEGANLVDFAYSARDDLIAVTSIRADGQHYIEMLKPDGRMLSSHPIERPPEIPRYRVIYPNFTPSNKQLVFSTGKQLFTLSYEGKVKKISLPFTERMMRPEFHPDGQRLLMIKGPYDSDIMLLPRQTSSDPNPTTFAQTKKIQRAPSFERSNLGEDYATFQPGGELIAFWSERSGEEQLWVSDGSHPRQLSQFPVDTYINGIDWAADGNSLLVNANNVLTQVTLDAKQTSIPLQYPVVQLFQWDSKDNSALALARIKGVVTLVEIDLDTAKIRHINDRQVLWALKSDDGRLIYKDLKDQFWQPGPAEDQRIDALTNQGTKSKSFLINNNVIYAINSQNRLWAYDLNNESYDVLGEVGVDIDYLTDINQDQILMTVRVSAKKEVVELIVSE